MSDFPCELCRDILVRLPAVSLFRFRSVCKAWQRMIDDPSFIKDHTNNQVYSNTLLVRNRTGDPMYSFSLDSLNFKKGPQQIEAARVKQLIHRSMPNSLRDVYHMASCNGLILISHKKTDKMWAIWNPLTGERHCLPRPDVALDLRSSDAFGLGYDRYTDDYKVVSVRNTLFSREDVDQTLVYSLKSGLWSMREACPYNLMDYRAAFWNGALYWRARNAVVAFDLRTERYFQLPLPPVDLRFDLCLDAFGGCLICNTYNFTDRTFDGWVMKDIGVWIKLFSLPYSIVYPTWKSRIVAYLERKEQVIIQCHQVFLWFDIGNDSVLKFSIHDLPHINFSIICPGSLVRLNFGRRRARAATGTSWILTRKRKKDMETAVIYNRLKLCVRDIGDKCCSDNDLCSEDSCTLCKEE